MPENNTKTELSQMPRIGRGGAGQMNSRVNVQKPKHMKQTIGRLLQYIGKSKFILFGLIAMMLFRNSKFNAALIEKKNRKAMERLQKEGN